jgi:hypothetical protein
MHQGRGPFGIDCVHIGTGVDDLLQASDGLIALDRIDQGGGARSIGIIQRLRSVRRQ